MRAFLMFFKILLVLMVALPSAASGTSGALFHRVLPKDSRIYMVLETPIDSSRISTGDKLLLALPDAEQVGEVVLPEATKLQGTVTCFSDPAQAHLKFIALSLETIQLPNGEKRDVSATFLVYGGSLHVFEGMKKISCPGFTTPQYEISKANLLGGSGGAYSADMLKPRKIQVPDGLVLPDGTTVLIVRGRSKIDLPSGSRVQLKLLRDLQLPNSIE